jgi:hypothetical protein
VFKQVKERLGGTLVPLVAALVLIGLGIALAHANPRAGDDSSQARPGMTLSGAISGSPLFL